MSLFRKKSKVATVRVPWSVEYRLRMLHMPNPQGKCTGCYKAWDKCPTLEIMDKYWEVPA